MEKDLRIKFPTYSQNNEKFQSLQLENELLVDYTHELDFIQNVKLDIRQMFVVFVVEGEVKLEEPSGVSLVHANQAMLVRSGRYLMSEQLSTEQNRFQAILFFLSDQMIQEFCLLQSVTLEKSVVSGDRHVWPINVSQPLISFFQSIVTLTHSSNDLQKNEALLKLKASELLFYLLESDQDKSLQNALCCQLNNEAMIIEDVMQGHVLQQKNLDEIAFLCGMSLSQFKRKFQSIFKTSPGKWLREKRLQHAEALLRAQELTVSEIAYTTGFETASNFIRLFKEKFGLTPGQFRQELESKS